jgi:hypothetical protein
MRRIHKGSLARLGGGHHRRIPGCYPARGSRVLPLVAWALSVGFRLPAQTSDRSGQEERSRPLGLQQDLKVGER